MQLVALIMLMPMRCSGVPLEHPPPRSREAKIVGGREGGVSHNYCDRAFPLISVLSLHLATYSFMQWHHCFLGTADHQGVRPFTQFGKEYQNLGTRLRAEVGVGVGVGVGGLGGRGWLQICETRSFGGGSTLHQWGRGRQNKRA